MSSEVRQRNINIELLRLFAAFMIVIGHFATKGGAAYIEFGTNQLVAQIVSVGGKLGVNLFIIISSYFLYAADFKISRIIRVWFETFFYSAGVCLIFILFRGDSVIVSNLILLKCLFPIFGEPYWYVSAYIGFLVMHPILKKIISSLSRNAFRYLLLALCFMFSICPMVFVWANNLYCNNLAWFLFVYLLIGYFRKYSIFVKLGKRRLVFMLLFGLSFIWCSMIVITLVGHFYPKYYELALIHFNYYSTMSLLPMLVSSIGLFGLFLVGRESSSKMISNIITVFAPSSFGVYLLHCHPLVKDDYIWRIFGCPNWFLSDTLSFVLRMLGSVLAIFVVSLMIDQVRIRMLEKPLLKSGWFNNVCNTVDSIINGLFI